MGITAKKLAELLNLSPTAVSMALHDKPGVSTETKKRVQEAAEKYGYDLSRINKAYGLSGTIYIIMYKAHNAILSYTPIFEELCEGVRAVANDLSLGVRIVQFYEKVDDLDLYMERLRGSDCIGIIMIGTEMSAQVCKRFLKLKLPFVLLDTSFNAVDCDCVLINNIQGAYRATDYLISRRQTLPGHLKSSYRIENFNERELGFRRAVSDNGFSPARAIVHNLAPTIEGACADMLKVIDSHEELAGCYFADNDIIAIGAMRALQIRCYRIPEDIGIIGFDNIRESRVTSPSLTTMSVSRQFMAETAARQLVYRIKNNVRDTSRIEISPVLQKRYSL